MFCFFKALTVGGATEFALNINIVFDLYVHNTLYKTIYDNQSWLSIDTDYEAFLSAANTVKVSSGNSIPAPAATV